MAVCIGGQFKRFLPHLLMTLSQIGFTFLYLITQASFKHGLNPHVYVTCRLIVASVVMFPVAYVLERNQSPKMTLALFVEIFILSLLGMSLPPNMYFASLRYTSSTFVAAVFNVIAPLTFVLAVALRLESLNLQNPRGIAKLVGSLVSLAGAMTMTLYKGPAMKSLPHVPIHIQGETGSSHKNWLKGSLLAVASCVAWAVWYIMQASTQKKYPPQLSLTVWMSFIGAAQSAFYTVIVEHTKEAWTIGFDIDLGAIAFSGAVMCGAVIFVVLWCTEVKGPVFVTMFTPLSTILVAVISYFMLGEKLFLGSIVGAIIIIIGLYLLLWGKEGDQPVQNKKENEVEGDQPITEIEVEGDQPIS